MTCWFHWCHCVLRYLWLFCWALRFQLDLEFNWLNWVSARPSSGDCLCEQWRCTTYAGERGNQHPSNSGQWTEHWIWIWNVGTQCTHPYLNSGSDNWQGSSGVWAPLSNTLSREREVMFALPFIMLPVAAGRLFSLTFHCTLLIMSTQADNLKAQVIYSASLLLLRLSGETIFVWITTCLLQWMTHQSLLNVCAREREMSDETSNLSLACLTQPFVPFQITFISHHQYFACSLSLSLHWLCLHATLSCSISLHLTFYLACSVSEETITNALWIRNLYFFVKPWESAQVTLATAHPQEYLITRMWNILLSLSLAMLARALAATPECYSPANRSVLRAHDVLNNTKPSELHWTSNCFSRFLSLSLP